MSYKLEAKYGRCLCVGYPRETNGYHFYNPLETKVIVSKHVVFLEKEFLLRGDSGSKVELEEVQGAQTDNDQLIETVIHEDEVTIEPFEAQAFRKSSRIRTIPKKYAFLVSEQE